MDFGEDTHYSDNYANKRYNCPNKNGLRLLLFLWLVSYTNIRLIKSNLYDIFHKAIIGNINYAHAKYPKGGRLMEKRKRPAPAVTAAGFEKAAFIRLNGQELYPEKIWEGQHE